MENIILTSIPLNELIQKLLEAIRGQSENYAKENHNKAVSNDWLNMEQAAVYLNIAKPTLYSMTSNNEIAFHKSGRKNVFLKSDLDNYLKERRRKTQLELSEEAVTHLRKGKGGKNGK